MYLDDVISVATALLFGMLLMHLICFIGSNKVYTIRTSNSKGGYLYQMISTRSDFHKSNEMYGAMSSRNLFTNLMLVVVAVNYALVLIQFYKYGKGIGDSNLYITITLLAYMFGKYTVSYQIDNYFFNLFRAKDSTWAMISSGRKTQYVTEVSIMPFVLRREMMTTGLIMYLMLFFGFIAKTFSPM